MEKHFFEKETRNLVDNLREGIWLRGDKQTVLASYKQEAFQMFEGLMARINDEGLHKIYRIQPQPDCRHLKFFLQKSEA